MADYDMLWIVEAAGENQRKLAQVALLLAALAIVTDSLEDHKEMLYHVTLAMEAIGKKFGMPPSEVMRQFRATVHKDA
jgi:AraC-like DNA-binding protein